jgi:uncharacterized protein with PIN domain
MRSNLISGVRRQEEQTNRGSRRRPCSIKLLKPDDPESTDTEENVKYIRVSTRKVEIGHYVKLQWPLAQSDRRKSHVLASGDASLIVHLSDLLDELGVEIVPFDAVSAWQAFESYTRLGKGIHPAGLNLLDCVAYQLARHFGHTILFTGNDFSRTDAVQAV